MCAKGSPDRQQILCSAKTRSAEMTRFQHTFSPDGELIVLTGPGMVVQVWRWRNSTLAWERELDISLVLDLAYSSDGQ